ncbi:N-acetyltransferase [Rhizobium sp. KAs_5_22]|uniref:GNAT family N-acetyltransferase n=1 Tax=Ciceribacter selenitireducens TaxID=448181 RepID=UPI00048B09A0|nr:GNAT family N-acetyltransferase [Ciceribacter selenitireducens]PPJ48128.1 N-acetyltransferase [Rhizobium sp. KAs_5_22]
MTIEIRYAEPADEVAWRRLWKGYLTFYKVDLPEEITNRTWARILDPSSRVAMRVALVGDQMAGFAIHHFHDSTWALTPDCYLEDLYLDEKFRGRGLGRALIDDLIALAMQKGWSRLYWHTNHDNATARKLYDTYAKEDGHVRYRMALA